MIDLRNRVHKEKFRFVLTPEHWKVLYVPEDAEKSHLTTVVKNERLKGYATYCIENYEQNRVYNIREICAEDQDTLTELIDLIVKKSVEDNVDFIFVRSCEETHQDVFPKKGFVSFSESVIMITLLDPKELLSALSKQIEQGKVLNLVIKGFDPITVRVGEKGIMVVKNEKPDSTVSTDAKTFLKLFFGRASFLGELLRRRITISGILNWTTANRFFGFIKQQKWHIPMGDWV